MKKVLLAMIIASGILSATDFSSMTTEELVSLKGTVAIEDREAFRTELQDRLSTMSVEDKKALGITPNGFGDMTGTAPADGTGLGNAGATTGGGFGAESAGGVGGGGHGQGGRR